MNLNHSYHEVKLLEVNIVEKPYDISSGKDFPSRTKKKKKIENFSFSKDTF